MRWIMAGFVVALLSCTAATPRSMNSLTQAPENYIMRISQLCFCPVEALGPFDVTVIKGQVVSLVRIKDQMALPTEMVGDKVPSLELMLEYIERAKQKTPYKKQITWIKEPYVPKRVMIDFSKMIADEEIDIRIESFELLP